MDGWGDEPDNRSVSPLQVAVESGSHELSVVLVQHFASTDQLDLTKMRSCLSQKDGHYYRLIQMFRLLDVQRDVLDQKAAELREKYKDYDVMKESDQVPTLCELASVSLRRTLSLKDAVTLIKSVDLGTKVEDYLFLKHVPYQEFPKLPIPLFDYDDDIYGDDWFDPDDEDDYFDEDSDMSDDEPELDHLEHFDGFGVHAFFFE